MKLLIILKNESRSENLFFVRENMNSTNFLENLKKILTKYELDKKYLNPFLMDEFKVFNKIEI